MQEYQLGEQRIEHLETLLFDLFEQESDESLLYTHSFQEACERISARLLEELTDLSDAPNQFKHSFAKKVLDL
ncbi:MAG: hypothetical protein KC422_20335 [Trueperaceae bacterium]|nr:hypothetical protein [Trueperaceae bacterium]